MQMGQILIKGGVCTNIIHYHVQKNCPGTAFFTDRALFTKKKVMKKFD